MLIWIEQLQSSGASFARVHGLGQVPADAAGRDGAPGGDRIEVRGVRFAYDGGRDVLHGVDLTVAPGRAARHRRPVRRRQVHPGPAAGRHRPARAPAR